MRKRVRQKDESPKYFLGEAVETPRGPGSIKYVFPVKKSKNRKTTYAVTLPKIRVSLIFNEDELLPLFKANSVQQEAYLRGVGCPIA